MTDSSAGGMEQVGASCDSCDWTLTIADVIECAENDNSGLRPTPKRIGQKFGSLSEGHAYFNRGHRISTHLSVEEIERALQTEADQ